MKNVIIIFFVMIQAYLHAQMVSGDKPYELIGDDKQEVIYTQEHSHHAHTLHDKLSKIHTQYAHSFDHNLTQRHYTVLGSSHNQVANAMATFLPLLRNELYSGGASMIDYFGAASWIDEIAVHELAHTYQLDSKHGTSHVLQNIFGNNGAWFINPNYLLPTFIIEGNAVMNESRASYGGRLFVGEHRAMVYALSKGGVLSYSRLLNNHIDFPFMTEKYVVGGYFFAYLSRIYGVDKVNAFFKSHAKHFINPLWLNESFEEHFGYDYRTLVGGFLMDLHQETKSMTLLKGKTLVRAHSFSALNHDDTTIWGIVSDQEGPHKMFEFDKSADDFTHTKTTLPLGKVFTIDGKKYSATQGYSAPNRIQTALFDEEYKALDSTKNRHILDMRNNKTAYFDMRNAYDAPTLFVDDEDIDTVHSSAILDEKGHVYYAKQEGRIRTIYKNSTPLASFKGYWSKLLEVHGDTLYLIANTEYGSTLYSLKDKNFTRLSSADNIVDARLVDDENFIAVSVDAKGYAIQKATIDSHQKCKPYVYAYNLKPLDINATQSTAHTSKAYAPHFNMHRATTGISGGYSSVDGVSAVVSMDFVDPMMYSYLHVAGGRLFGGQTALMQYSNTQHLLNYAVAGGYSDDVLFAGKRLQLQAQASYTLARTNRYIAQVLSQYDAFLSTRQTHSLVTSFRVASAQRFALAQDWHRYLQAMASHRYYDGYHSATVDTQGVYELWPTLFAHARLKGGISQRSDLVLSNNVNSWYANATTVGLYSRQFQMLLHSFAQGRVGLKKAFRTPGYDAVFPIGVRRTMIHANALAMVFDASRIYGTNAQGEVNTLSSDYSRLYELNVGVSWELLAAHLSPFDIGMDYTYNSLLKNTTVAIRASASF